jgi:hypothetical protein
MKILALAFFCGLFIQIDAQENHLLSPQDKAYLFHTVKKSPILDQNLGRFFEYTGEEILLPNGTLNYDSMELMIINQPDILRIYTDEIKKSPKGLLAEAANKQAVWELNKVLQAKRADELDKEGYVEAFARFEAFFQQHLPENAFKRKKGEVIVHPKVENALNPSLSFQDKLATLNAMSSLTAQDKKGIIDAASRATNQWVQERSYAIFQHLGGEALMFLNVLTAAGDGSNTSGLFEEREKDERGRWNKGMPKAVGLFPYQTILFQDPKRSRESIRPEIYAIHQFESAGNNRMTNIHLDVWGYNSDKQTTVVIEKQGKSYPLFGSSETRFLSPDSSFASGITYYALINQLQIEINELEEMISGKKGFDYWIAFHEKRKQGKLLEIDKTEKLLSDLRMSPIKTNDKKYNTKSGKKRRKKNQENVVRYYEELSAIKRKILELETLKEEVILKQNNKLQDKGRMLDLIGREWVPFSVEDGRYVFADSSTFDMYTQEFTFPPRERAETFEIRLLAIPLSHESHQADEVMLHINVMDAKPLYNARIQLELLDAFGSDEYELTTPLFSSKDSIAIRVLFDALLDKKKPINTIVSGGGIGKWNGFRTVIDREPKTLSSYPGRTIEEKQRSKMDSSFLRLRTAQVFIGVDREIQLEINSFTDPVVSNISNFSEAIRNKKRGAQLSKNELLSAYRSRAVLLSLKKELNELAGSYLSREEAKIVIDRLNKAIDMTRISVGRTSFDLKEL